MTGNGRENDPSAVRLLAGGLDLRLLSSFVAVADELHFGRAAERLQIAQPALSRQIRRLEDQVGSRLLERSTRDVRLTRQGELVLAAAADILATADRAAEAARGASGNLAVRVMDSVAPRLKQVIGRFVAAYPEVDVDIQSSREAVLPAVVAGEVNATVDMMQVLPPGVRFAPCVRVTAGLAYPAGHRLAGRTTVTWADLAGERVIVAPESHSAGYNHFVRRHLAEANVSVEEVVGPRVNPALLSSSIASGGLGLNVCPPYTHAPLPEDLLWVPIEPVARFEFGVMWRSSDDRETTRTFVRWVTAAARELSAGQADRS